MENTVEKLMAEKVRLHSDLVEIGEHQFRHGKVMLGFGDDVIEKRRQSILRRLVWLNTEIWLVQHAQPSSPVR